MLGRGDIADSTQNDPVKLYLFRNFRRPYDILYRHARRRAEGSVNPDLLT